MPQFTISIAVPDPPSMPWGVDDTPPDMLDRAAVLTLAKVNSSFPDVRRLDTEWTTGPQNNPVLNLIATTTDFGYSLDVMVLQLIATIFQLVLADLWASRQRSRNPLAYSPAPSPEPRFGG